MAKMLGAYKELYCLANNALILQVRCVDWASQWGLPQRLFHIRISIHSMVCRHDHKHRGKYQTSRTNLNTLYTIGDWFSLSSFQRKAAINGPAFPAAGANLTWPESRLQSIRSNTKCGLIRLPPLTPTKGVNLTWYNMVRIIKQYTSEKYRR